MKYETTYFICLALASITLGILDPLRPAQKVPDPVLPFGPQDVSIVRYHSTISEKMQFFRRSTVVLADTMYICPTRDLLPGLLKYCDERRTKIYVENGFDCEDHASEFKINAARWSVNTYGSSLHAGIAVGEVYVKIYGPVEGLEDFPVCQHALNILCLSDGQLVFIEPTTGKWVNVEGPIYEGVIEVMFIRM